jgi:hypothetical protein
LGRGGDDRRGLSHDGRGGGGGALVGEEVPGEEEVKLGLNSCRRMRGSYWSSGIGRRYKLDGGRSLPAKGRTAAR